MVYKIHPAVTTCMTNKNYSSANQMEFSSIVIEHCGAEAGIFFLFQKISFYILEYKWLKLLESAFLVNCGKIFKVINAAILIKKILFLHWCQHFFYNIKSSNQLCKTKWRLILCTDWIIFLQPERNFNFLNIQCNVLKRCMWS